MVCTALLVDDSKIARMMIRRILPDFLTEIREAQNGAECLTMYEEQRPDIVLLDLTMPGMHGFEVLDELKKRDPTANVIVLTADIQGPNRARAHSMGALGILGKPVVAQDLDAALRRVS